MNDHEEKFVTMIEHICARPALYLGRADFRLFVAFLDGYTICSVEHGLMPKPPFAPLLYLLEHAHGFTHPGWGWPRHYLHEKGSHAQAFKDFPAFFKASMATSETRIKELHRTRDSLSHTPPSSPQTAEFELPNP